jgi:hypothetical protein
MWCASWGCTTPAGASEPYIFKLKSAGACQRAAPLAHCAHAGSSRPTRNAHCTACKDVGSAFGKFLVVQNRWVLSGCAVAVMRRGAHTFFLRTGQVPRWGGYTVNLIHYEDAASLSAAVRASLIILNIRPG